jgi:O-antigen/teichoic acid export membrane protein
MKQLANALMAQRLPLRASAGLGIALFATVALDIALIPLYGAVGASIASTIAYVVGAVAVGSLFLRALGGRPADLVPRSGDAAFVWAAARRQLGRREPAELSVE